MSSYDDEPTDTRARRLISDRQERLEHMLDLFSKNAADVSLTPEMKREIAVHIVNYHRVLSTYRDETVLDDDSIPDISPIRERLGATTKVLTESKRRGGGATYEETPAIDELDFWYLERVATQLEAAAKQLGFWASAADTVHNDSVTEDDLKALLTARGQEQAIENLPSEHGGDA